MVDSMFIRAKSGLKIRDPLTRLMLPDEGTEVVESAFWHRLVRDGDAEIVEQPVRSKESKK